jgi:hypothetical protein
VLYLYFLLEINSNREKACLLISFHQDERIAARCLATLLKSTAVKNAATVTAA